MKICKKLLSLFLMASVLFVGLPVANVLNGQEIVFAEEVSMAEKTEDTTSEKSCPKVSVIVPVYNTERYLKECLDSIKNQTLKEIEIICVNDGSPDNCGKILDEYAAKDSRFIVVHQENKGVSEARNAGLDVATGEYITFVDPDDYLQLDAYEVAYNLAKKDDVDMLQFGHRDFKDGESFSFEKVPLVGDIKIMNRNEFIASYMGNYVWDKLIKNDLIKKCGVKFLRGMKVAQDAIFVYMALCKIKKIMILSNNLYNYRLRSTAVSKSNNKDVYAMHICNSLKYVYNFWREQNCLIGNEHIVLHLLMRLLSWFRPNTLKYAQEIVASFGLDIYNAEIVKKCDEQTKKLIRELEYAAQHPEKFQIGTSETKKFIHRKTATKRLQRKVAA